VSLLYFLLIIPIIGIFLISTIHSFYPVTVEKSMEKGTRQYTEDNKESGPRRGPDSSALWAPESSFFDVSYYKKIALITTILNLIVSLVIYMLFDFSNNQYQFIQENLDLSFYDIYLGVDGISIYFVVRPLTKLLNINIILLLIFKSKPVLLRTITELTLCKPINLLEIEMIRGMKHVNKVLDKIKYKFYLWGEVIYIHALIIMLLQSYILASKVLDTKIHSFARPGLQNATLGPEGLSPSRPALFTLQQKRRLWPNFIKSGQSVRYSTTSRASKDFSNNSHKFYENADTQKLEILTENQNKSGIYQWVNKINGKTYIGSSKNLGRRFRNYFNISFLVKKIEKGKSMIYNALLKNGYSNFTLKILEYCDATQADLLKREQYYIDKLNPEYNILKTAGTSLEFKHSDETRVKMSNSRTGEKNPMFGLKHSDEIRAKISNSLVGERNPMFGKIGSQNPRFGKQHSSETRAKISIFKAGKPRPQGAGKSPQPVEVIDIKNNIKNSYDSISATASALGIKSATISKYFSNNQKKPYNGQYIFIKSKPSCRHYSSLSQSLARMNHTKCNHKRVEKQNACLSSWLLKKVLSLKQWAKDIISGFFLGTGDLLSLVIGINNLTLKWVNEFIFIQAYLYNLYIQYLSKGDGVIVVQTQNSLEGSQETVISKFRAGEVNTLHSICKRSKTYGYNPYGSIHLNSQRILVWLARGTQKQKFSTSPNLASLHPWFITGLTDAEGCFMINILKAPNMKVGWRVQPVFQIGLHAKDENLLKEIKAFFEDQGFLTKINNNSLIYRLFSIEMLEKVINHFDSYPLQTKKRADFELFKSVVMLVKSKKHLSIEGLQEIVNHKASLNKGLTPNLKESFPKYCPVARISDIVNHQNLDPQWLAGFTAGEGSFSVNISRNSGYKTGYLVNLRFQLSQHSRDENLLISLIDYFGCGQYYSLRGTQSRGDFVVTKLSDILNIIIPFYLKNPILGLKAYDFQLWCKVSEIMLKKEHLTLEGLEKIQEIKTKMNKYPSGSKE